MVVNESNPVFVAFDEGIPKLEYDCSRLRDWCALFFVFQQFPLFKANLADLWAVGWGNQRIVALGHEKNQCQGELTGAGK